MYRVVTFCCLLLTFKRCHLVARQSCQAAELSGNDMQCQPVVRQLSGSRQRQAAVIVNKSYESVLFISNWNGGGK